MKSIFEYLDYRVYLKDFYEEKKNAQSFFSYRLFGNKVGIDSSYLAKVFLHSRHIADESITAFAVFCGLKEKEAEYFETLVHFSKSKSHKKSKLYFEKLLSIKNINTQKLVAQQYAYYQKWYYSALRSVLEYYEFTGDYKLLAAVLNPPITPKEAKAGIALLSKLGLVRVNEAGIYKMTDTAITSGSQWQSLAIEAFQEETIRLSQEAIQRHPKNQRDVSTVTLNINAHDFTEIRERVKEFRGTLINYVNAATHPDRTYQLNVQFFPLSKIGGKGK